MRIIKGGKDDSRPGADTSESAEMSTFVAGTTEFAAALYARAARNSGNVFLSPASASVALAMTYAGARGETAAEMERALRFGALEPTRVHAVLGALVTAIGDTPGVEVAIANALFGQKGYDFLPEFHALLTTHYGAGLREVDFANETEAARLAINAWVKQQTAEKIADLVPAGLLGALTRLVLVNAIYFKGSWAEPFLERNTTDQPFFRLDGHSSRVPLMHQSGDYGLVDVEDAQLLALPYEGGAMAMVAILPRRHDGLPDIEAKLGSNLDQWLTLLDDKRQSAVDLYLPRFQVESALRLDEALQHLGMSLAFDPKAADFSGMASGARDLYIGAVLHKAFVEVNEKGTTAAAATAVVAMRGLAQRKVVFRADHPFVFLIVDTRTRCVLFLGRVS